ncbi:MAG: hypothetical protein ACE37H_04730 [Phycisphaeraceae bacterium]
MDLKATVASGYRNRLILITLGALLYAAWAYYDATVKYPEQIEVYETYQDIREANESDWNKVWAEKIKETGWPEQPKKRTQSDIGTQWILFGITFPIGALCLIMLIKWSRKYVGADRDTLYANGGVEVPFDKISKIDASRWEAKGIARVRYDVGAGEKELVIDDWKYTREPSDQIFARLRERVDPQKIEGLEEGGPHELSDEDDFEGDSGAEPTQESDSTDEQKTSSSA